MIFKKFKTTYLLLKFLQYISFLCVLVFNTRGIMDLFKTEETTNLAIAIFFLIGAIILGTCSSMLKSYALSQHIRFSLDKQQVAYSNLKLHKNDLFTYDLLDSESQEVISKKIVSILYRNKSMFFVELEEGKSPATILNKNLEIEKGFVSIDPITEKISTEIITIPVEKETAAVSDSEEEKTEPNEKVD